jgi:hypothetical protein
MNPPPDSSSLDDAVDWLQSQGLHAFRRKWSLGDSIGVAGSASDHEGVTVFNDVVFIYLDENRWSVVDLDNGRTQPAHFGSMTEALLAARDRTNAKLQEQAAAQKPTQ